MIWLLLTACTPTVDVPDSTLESGLSGQVVLTTTDFSTGALSVLDLATGEVEEGVAPTSPDPLVTVSGGQVIQLNGYLHDTVRIYEPHDWSEPLGEYGVGQAANPHDAEQINGELWLSLYGRDALEIREPASGVLLDTVDLSTWADADGLPEAASLLMVESRLLVALQRFDRTRDWAPLPGHIVAIDTDTRQVVGDWAVGTSPRLSAHSEPGHAWVVTGSYADGEPALDGAVTSLSLEDGLGDVVWDEGMRGERVDHWLDAGSDWAAMVDLGGTYAVRCFDGTSWRDGPESTRWTSDAILDGNGRVLLASRELTGGGGVAAVRLEDCSDAGFAETALAPYQMAPLQ